MTSGHIAALLRDNFVGSRAQPTRSRLALGSYARNFDVNCRQVSLVVNG